MLIFATGGLLHSLRVLHAVLSTLIENLRPIVGNVHLFNELILIGTIAAEVE